MIYEDFCADLLTTDIYIDEEKKKKPKEFYGMRIENINLWNMRIMWLLWQATELLFVFCLTFLCVCLLPFYRSADAIRQIPVYFRLISTFTGKNQAPIVFDKNNHSHNKKKTLAIVSSSFFIVLFLFCLKDNLLIQLYWNGIFRSQRCEHNRNASLYLSFVQHLTKTQ